MESEQQQFLKELKHKNQFPKTFLEQIDFWEKLLTKLPRDLWGFLGEPTGSEKFVKKLPDFFPPDDVANENSEQRQAWDLVGLAYFGAGRFHEALAIFTTTYYHILKTQEKSGNWYHKGTPLVRMNDCFSAMGFRSIAKRYLMLTLCEDAIAHGKENRIQELPNDTGVYSRLVWGYGLSEAGVIGYANDAYAAYKQIVETDGETRNVHFPEYILQKLDRKWTTEVALPNEAAFYFANSYYIEHLAQIIDRTGKSFELLAEYLLSCMPGCITNRRQRSHSTDYDVICSMDGLEADFRSEFGRYFVCECKDWKKKANVTTMAKFCYVLDSVKARFGILFSKKGISGTGKKTNAERERLKVFQNRGIVIVVIDEKDLQDIIKGHSFISLLRQKYEEVRLDLPSSQASMATIPK